MLSLRILTAALGIPLVFVATYLGGIFFVVLVMVVAVAALREWLALTAKIFGEKHRFIGYISMLLVLLSAYYGNGAFLLPALIVSLLSVIFSMVFYYPNVNLGAVVFSYFGGIFIGSSLLTILLLRNSDQFGFWGIVAMLAVIWATDSGAYFTGRAWGKKKLAPQISPKKTWTGFYGGLVSAGITGILFSPLLPVTPFTGFTTALFISLAGQLGDLGESVIKRVAGVKDSGKLLPGHGGMLDRIDSLLLAAPVVYIFLSWFIID